MIEDIAALQAGLGGTYTIERELGRGGMATVYLAEDAKHGRPVALKVLHPDLAASLGPERFRREISFAAKLQHPHILTVLDSGVTPAGQLWFTMPYVEGETLRQRMTRQRQLPLADALRITREVASALTYAHGKGVIHRDIKPENILLTTGGEALLADFGIARALTQRTDSGAALTETGVAVGTPQYMSPEQASGERTLGVTTDVYSLGAVLYEMLAGEPPFTGPTAQAVVAKMMSSEAPSVRRVRPSVPESVDAAIRRALAPVPADRFATAGELSQALDVANRRSASSAVTPAPAGAASATAAASPSVPSAAGTSRRRIPTGVALLGLGFLVGAGALFAWRSTRSGGTDGTSGPVRLAVLPFDNLGDSADAYFADGLTDAIRGKLTVVPGLQVTASTSSGQYRHTTKSPQQVGQELGVRYLLVGKVRWARGTAAGAGRVEVSPELIDVTTASDKWQQPFDAQLTDVFQMQADIAGQVTQKLKVALTPAAEQEIAARPTDNLAAYDEFLKGEAASQSMGTSDVVALTRAVGFYEKAVAMDSTFAPAWAELSRAHAELYANANAASEHARPAQQAAERAAALAPKRIETALAEGDYYGSILGQPSRALDAYAAGLQSAPRNAALLASTALVERSLGRWDAAIAHFQEAEALDPRSVATERRLAVTYMWQRRLPEARARFDHILAFSPDNSDGLEGRAMVALARGDLAEAHAALQSPNADPAALEAFVGSFWDLYWALDDAQQRQLLTLGPDAFGGDRATRSIVLAQTYALRGDHAAARLYADSARRLTEAAIRTAPDNDGFHSSLGLALAYLGQGAEAVKEGERAVALQAKTSDAWGAPYTRHQLVRIYLIIGEPEKALDLLEPLLQVPYYLTPAWLKIDPNFAPLRGNPRFERLVNGQG